MLLLFRTFEAAVPAFLPVVSPFATLPDPFLDELAVLRLPAAPAILRAISRIVPDLVDRGDGTFTVRGGRSGMFCYQTHMTTPYDSADPELLEEIISQGEKRLQGQLELGKAADQRAMTFAGLLFAGVALLAGLAFGDRANPDDRAELIFVAGGFILAAALAGWSARSSGWDIIGNAPINYTKDIEAHRKLAQTRVETAHHLQDMISRNHEILLFNSKLINWSMTIAMISATAGLIAAIVD